VTAREQRRTKRCPFFFHYINLFSAAAEEHPDHGADYRQSDLHLTARILTTIVGYYGVYKAV